MAQSYSKQIKEAKDLDGILEVIEKLEDSSLPEAKKEKLLIDAHAKKNGIEEGMRDEGKEPPIDKETKEAAEEKKKPKKPPTKPFPKGAPAEPPTKTVEVNVDELKAYEKSGRLYGCVKSGKTKFTAKVLLSLAFVFLMASSAFAVKEATLGNLEADGDYRWEVQAGDLIPGTDDSYDVGSDTKAAAEVHTKDLHVETLFSIDAILITNLPATGTTSSSSNVVLYWVNDAASGTDCSTGGGIVVNLCAATLAGWADAG